MPEVEALAHNLKHIRKKVLKLSQEDFAAYCGISTETLSILECEKGDPRLSTIQKIAAYLDCDVIKLLTKGDDEN